MDQKQRPKGQRWTCPNRLTVDGEIDAGRWLGAAEEGEQLRNDASQRCDVGSETAR